MKKIMLFLSLAFVYTAQGEQKSISQKILEPRISYETSYLCDAKIAQSDGSVSVYKNQFQLNQGFFSFSYSNWKFDWDNIEALPFGDGIHSPIPQIHAFQANVNHRKKIDDELSFLTSFSVKSTFEKQIEDSFGVNLFSFASYSFNNEHSIQVGGFANYHPTSTLVLPIMSYSYRERFNEGWQFVFGFPRTYLGYHIYENTLVRFGVMFSQSLVRLSNESVINPGGYVEAKDYISNLGLSYELNKNLTFSGDILYTLKREFTLYDARAHQVQDHMIRNPLGVNMRLVYIF